MSYPNCQQHTNRRLEVICVEPNCPKRFTLQCLSCLNSSACMKQKHIWKIVDEFIEEIFEVCQTEQAKFEKKVKPGSFELQKHQVRISEIITHVDTHLEDTRKRLIEKLEGHANTILQPRNKQPELHFKMVKNSINSFRRSEVRQLETLNKLLRNVNDMVLCDESGVLSLKPIETTPVEINHQQIQRLEDIVNRIKGTLASLLEGSPTRLQVIQKDDPTNQPVITTQTYQKKEAQQKKEVDKQGGQGNQEVTVEKQTQDEFDKQRQSLYNHINSLNEQIKQIPVLKQRIEDQALKIQVKSRKIAQYQMELSKSQSPSSSSASNELSKQLHDLMEKQQQRTTWRAERINRLLELRDHLSKMAIDHCKKCERDTIKYERVYPTEDALKVNYGRCYCDTAYLINLSTNIIADDLNSLGFSEQVEGNPWISMTVIVEKIPSPKKPSNPMYDKGYKVPPYTKSPTYQPYFT